MAFNPEEYLTEDQKASIVQDRIRNWAADAYGHKLNKEATLAINPDADTSEADAAIETIGAAIASVVGGTPTLEAPEGTPLWLAREKKRAKKDKIVEGTIA